MGELTTQPLNQPQGELFTPDEVLEQTNSMLKAYESKAGQVSGTIIEREKEKGDYILELLVDPNITHKEIARRCKVSRNTVAALERRADLDGRLVSYKQRALEKVRVLHRMATEALMEALRNDELKGKDKAITWGIVSDHLEKFEGMPTQIHEVRQEISAEQFNERMDQIRSRLAEKNANIIEVDADE